MNVFLWILQILLALAFLGAGASKLLQPKEKLQKNMAYVEDFSAGTVKVIGAVEVLGALGLILPAATGIAPVLTPLAATGLLIVMALAIVVHLRRGEGKMVPINVVLLVIAAIIAWGRFGPYHF
ncbi:DoxX family protein [Planosporangium thailandense]|uniref:DoxX family protein n=1 Tax=Planosporangium thailandense TaxID=765197 RepID=A0ABX0Y7I4_9ACTN|nr:DoxX family protein [Planosporangium thailandense]NJC73385.1 DoxX family protein [Planosporangium thailandense]